MTWELRQGHVLDVLASLPAESVQCVVTSPPYWGLRAYKTEPQVWGGDAGECEHEWGNERYQHGEEWGHGPTDFERNPEHKNPRQAGLLTPTTVSRGSICTRCGAWRGELGSEPTIELYVEHIVAVFRAVKRVLRNDGTVFLNVGDSYAGSGERGGGSPVDVRTDGRPTRESDQVRGRVTYGAQPQGTLKAKDLCLIPFRLALALQADGWYVRSDIAWCKRAPMPESVTDRPTTAWEHVFLLSKSSRYFYDADAVRESFAEGTEDRYEAGYNASWKRAQIASPTDKRDAGAYGSPDAMRRHPARNQWNYWLLSPEPFSGWTQTSHRVPVAPGDADDGTTRIASPDCPVHGDRPDRATNARGDGRATGDLSRTGHNGDRLDPLPLFDSAPIATSHAPDSADDSSDSPRQPYVPAATARSTESHRTDLAPVTSLAYSVSARTPDRTDDTPGSPDPSDSDARTGASSTEADSSQDASGSGPSGETTSRTAHTDTCTCTFYRTVTESISHFATFPTEIPKRAILAGTSERGCCPQCGAPWRRVVERTRHYESGSGRAGNLPNGKYHGTEQAESGDYDIRMGPQVDTQTLGWEPTCAHGLEPVGCTVLDPFSGSGTTGMVALRHNRRYIGIELNAEYVEMSKRRIVGDAPLFNGDWAYEPHGKGEPDKQGALGKRTYTGFNARWDAKEQPRFYTCEPCGITLPLTALTSGCPQCGETMVPA